MFIYLYGIFYCILIQFAGENKYGATIDVVVNITKDTYKTDLRIKSVNPEVPHEMFNA